MRQGLTAYKATRARLWRPHFLGLLATALSKAGHVEDALATADEGLDRSGILHGRTPSHQGKVEDETQYGSRLILEDQHRGGSQLRSLPQTSTAEIRYCWPSNATSTVAPAWRPSSNPSRISP